MNERMARNALSAAASKRTGGKACGNGGKACGKGGKGGEGGKGGKSDDDSDSCDEEGDLGSDGEDEDGNAWERIDALTKEQARERFSSKAKVNKKRPSEHKKTHYDAIWAACRAFSNSGPFGVGNLRQNRDFLVKALKLDVKKPKLLSAKKRGVSADELGDSEEEEDDDGDDRKKATNPPKTKKKARCNAAAPNTAPGTRASKAGATAAPADGASAASGSAAATAATLR